MKHSLRIAAVLPAWLLACAGHKAHAQAGSVIPVPFVTTYAGIPTGSGNAICSQSIPQLSGVSLGDGCPATQAEITTLYDVEVDAEGNVYTGEQSSNYDVRMVYKGGTTAAALILATNPQNASLIGTPVPGDIYTIGGGLTATLTKMSGIYYCGNKVGGVQAINSIGDGCPASEAFVKPKGMAIDPYGDVIMVNTELYDSVRVIYAGGPQMAKLITLENPSVTNPQVGYIYELAGTGAAGTEGDGGLAISAGFIAPRYIALDSQLNIYVTDGTTNVSGSTTVDNSGNNIREINISTGIITTYAGENYCETQPGGYSASTGCPNGFTGDGGPATSALLHSPYAIFFDHNDNLFITDDYNARVRVVYKGGTLFGISNPVVGNIYTYIGGGTIYGTDGTSATQVGFGSATSAATINTGGIDKAGNVYVLDGVVHNLWRFDAVTGIGTIVGGGGVTSTNAPQKGAYCSGGTSGPVSTDSYGDGCPAIQADVAGLGTLSFDSSGNFYFATSNSELEKFSFNNSFGSTADGTPVTQSLAFKDIVATTLNGESFGLQGAATTEFSDAGGDTCTQTQVLALKAVCVFKVTFNPAHDGMRPGYLQLSTSAGTALTEDLTGTGVASDIAIDSGTSSTVGTGLSPSGVGTDLLGNVYVADANTGHLLKGAATGTTLTSLFGGLNAPSQVAVDNVGNIFVADAGNNRIFEASSTGATIASLGTGLSAPKGVAVDGLGNAIVADTGNNRILKIAPNGYQLTLIPFGELTPALSSPTAVQVDASGDIYVLDSGNQRVLEYNVTAGTIAPVTLDTGVIPAGLGIDPAGDVYIVNSAANDVLVYPVGATSGNILISGLKSPVGVAVDADANLFIADTSQLGALELRRSLGNIAFPLTNLNTSTTASISISNVGNTSLTFPATPTFTISGSNSALFSMAPAASSGCAVGTLYAPGAGCNFTATFAPTANVNASATAVFNTNAVNTATAKAQLTGVGKLLVPTTVAVTISPAAVYYAQSVSVTVTVTPSTTTTTPSGTFTLVLDGKTQPAVSIGTGSYTVSLNLVVGTHTISATYSGDTTYASSTGSDTFTVNPAVTSTSLTVAPVNNNGSISLLFTAVVTATTATGQSGTVTFYAGTTAISPAIAISSANSYTATYSTSTLSFPSSALTAAYSGSANGNFAPSTSAVLQTSGGDFAVGSAAQSFSIPQGGIGQLGITLAPLFGGTGNITATCSGLPQNSVCRFDPDDIALSGSTPLNLSVQVDTNVSSTLAWDRPQTSGRGILLAFGVPLGLALLLSRRRRLRAPAVLLLAVALAMGTSGCGNGNVLQTFSTLVTPAGTYPITITFVGSNGLTETHTASATFTVVTNP
jgi:sugar lactone lactonase YvrE